MPLPSPVKWLALHGKAASICNIGPRSPKSLVLLMCSCSACCSWHSWEHAFTQTLSPIRSLLGWLIFCWQSQSCFSSEHTHLRRYHRSSSSSCSLAGRNVLPIVLL